MEKFESIFLAILSFMIFALLCIPVAVMIAAQGSVTVIVVLSAVPAVALGGFLWAHLAD